MRHPRFQYPRFLKILPKPEEGDVKKAELMLSHPFSVNESLADHGELVGDGRG